MVLVLMGCGAAVSLGCDPVNNQASVVGTALSNLWIFIVAPMVGGALAAGLWKIVDPEKK